MINVAVLGYGVVGSGVVEVLRMNKGIIDANAGKKVRIKYVLDIIDFPNDPVQEFIVHDFDTIVNDEEVNIVVEAMGGLEPAYTFVKRALLSKKHVCTSNKALVAEYGNELIKCAKENNVSFLFEASCGGGIPIIRPLNTAMVADEISSIVGILNGTTNYILTHMEKDNLGFADVLKEAQSLGYAEKNPASDIEGLDSCRKLAILSSIAYENYFDYKEIKTEGITKIDINDMLYAKAIDKKIKLLGFSKKEDSENTFAIVAPFLISNNNPLYNVNDVLNAILVHGNAVNDVMYYGSGAGKLPTASAVVSDIVEIAKNIDRHIPLRWNSEKLELSDIKDIKFRYFVRIKGNKNEMQDELEHIFGSLKKVISLDEIYGEFAVITNYMSENRFNEVTKDLDCVLNRIRIFNENK